MRLHLRPSTWLSSLLISSSLAACAGDEGGTGGTSGTDTSGSDSGTTTSMTVTTADSATTMSTSATSSMTTTTSETGTETGPADSSDGGSSDSVSPDTGSSGDTTTGAPADPCAATPEDTDCDTCVKNMCCDQLTMCNEDPDCVCFQDCAGSMEPSLQTPMICGDMCGIDTPFAHPTVGQVLSCSMGCILQCI